MWVNPDDQSAEVKEKSPLTFDDELAQLQAMLQKKKSEYPLLFACLSFPE